MVGIIRASARYRAAIRRLRYSSYLLLLCLAPLCPAQQIKVRIINGANGHPLPKQAVDVSFFYDKKYDKEIPAKYDPHLSLETDANGAAQFQLPEPPPSHFAAQVRVDWSRWRCGCGMFVATDELLHKGVVGPLTPVDAKKYALKPAPGEILFVFTPLSFIERLLYPITKY